MQLPFLVRGETRATSSSAKSADRMSVYASPQVMGYWSRSKTIAEITGPLCCTRPHWRCSDLSAIQTSAKEIGLRG
ncbi:hypothetical protein, partial [Ralstonia solanacearum]|uniref:hypothetical protein n=1 Tax=Ralstonia solanacearum TaxID=305 RepID=UPI001E4AA8A2